MELSLLEQIASKAVEGGLDPKERRKFLIEARKLIKAARTSGRKLTHPKVQPLADMLEQVDQEMEGVSPEVDEDFACPGCAERWMDQLIHIDDGRVKCHTCGIIYHPVN